MESINPPVRRSSGYTGTGSISTLTVTRSLSDIARVFEDYVAVKDRRYRLKLYKDCFIGTDAVTCLHEILTKFDPRYSRKHAEILGRCLAKKFRLFQHVTNDHTLQDDYFMYRFTHKERRATPLEVKDDDEELLEDLLAGLMPEDVDEESEREYDEFTALAIMMEATSVGRTRSSLSSSMLTSPIRRIFSTSASSEVAALPRRSLTSPTTRTQTNPPLRTQTSPPLLLSPPPPLYKGGNISIDDQVTHDEAGLREAAASFEMGVEVTSHRYNGHTYENTFIGTDAVDFLIASRLATSRDEAEALGKILLKKFNLFEHVLKEFDFVDNYCFYRFTDKNERTGLNVHPRTNREEFSPEKIAEDFEKSVAVADRRARLHTYKDCFVGSQAISFLVMANYASSRGEAVTLGRDLARKMNLFEHVTQNHELEDDHLFYRFTERGKRVQSAPEPSTIDEVATLMKVADEFRRGVMVGTHYYRFKNYKRTFTGSEAVDFMVNSSMAATRKDACLLGHRLSEELNLFHHVSREHRFRDDFLFYRFDDDDSESGSTESRFTSSAEKLEEVAAAMRKDIKVKNRRWYHRVYKHAFVGSEAVTYLVDSGAAKTRVEAVQLGRELSQVCKLFDHVEREHEFADAQLFYSFTPIIDTSVEHDASTLRSIAEAFEQGVEIGDRRFRLRIYKNAFIGKEAVAFLMKAGFAESREEATRTARSLAKTFNLFEHVTREHEFEDDFYFYRFMAKSERLLWKEDRQLLLDEDIKDDQFLFLEDDDDDETQWKQRIAVFETKLSLRRKRSTGVFSLSDSFKGEIIVGQEQTTANRTQQWFSQFRRLDPRWRILNFFTEVAQIGAQDVEKYGISLGKVRPLLWFLSRAKVFTVWRPTQFEAIRKMMIGQAVGKGLDIKGKSAKRGKLSGYVPFLQIGENRHKTLIRTLPKAGTLRVYFTSYQSRDLVIERLEYVTEEMMDLVARAKEILADKSRDESSREEAKEYLLCDVSDPSIAIIDDYAPSRYGIDVPARVFWEAFVARQDCTRKPGSQYDSGRPSTPAFQDMNLAALLAKPSKDSPRAVIYQNADPSDPMNPLELLMAYEEHGRVLPVVSDFDPFLVGTSRISFSPEEGALPTDQLECLMWMVHQIGTILDGPTRPEVWTNRWLEVLTKESRKGFHPTIPRFGFGDPKSYSIMQNAVSRLTGDGAVRHGAECFNYYFPQELDDEFLVISDTLEPIPWKYMNASELQDFLSTRVDESFTFPLNPKWVLCDPGWKSLYDKLLSSDKECTQNSMKIWFPPESGIREKIDEIYSRNPGGFERGMRVAKA